MAKKDVSAIVSGAGLVAHFVGDLIDAVRERGGTDEDIHRLVTPDGKETVGQIADIIVRARYLVLRLAGEAHVPGRTEPFDPSEFFQTREDLWVSDGLRDRVVSVAMAVEHLEAATFSKFDLMRSANDAGIRAELPGDHVWEVSAFCAHLATMITRQSKGEQGDLLTNGYVNVFYVHGVNGELCAVSVYWNSDRREWYVYAYRLGDRRWHVGGRVFSSNC